MDGVWVRSQYCFLTLCRKRNGIAADYGYMGNLITDHGFQTRVGLFDPSFDLDEV